MASEGGSSRVIAGRYRLLARLGRGGMGVVWRASDEVLGREVAVKELRLDETLSADEGRQLRERMLREARIVAGVRHPHVIVVHDVVVEDEQPYIVMEVVDGGSLADRLATQGPVSAPEAARLCLALLGALRAAHARGVLHRDIKPGNVLLEAGTDRAVLTDFGIAQVAGATTLTEYGSFVGSPEYTAPERMAGGQTGPESDLWSLGVLLCAAVTGESPFHRDSLGGVLHAVVMDEIRPPAAVGPLLPAVRGLLERSPERRIDAVEAERLLRTYVSTGTMPQVPAGYTPTHADVRVTERAAMPTAVPGFPADATPASVASGAPVPIGPDKPTGPGGRRSRTSALVAGALVVAVAGAGAGLAALLLDRGDGRDDLPPVSSAPESTDSTQDSDPPAGPSGGTSPGPTVSVTEPGEGGGPKAPDGYRIAKDAEGYSLAVPRGFVRERQTPRVFYLSPDGTIRIGIKSAKPEKGGPVAAMRRQAADGPDNNPGYRDGRVTETTHNGRTAALWEFTWDGFTKAEGERHTFDLSWEEGGRMYDVWVSAPVARKDQAKRHFDTALDTFRVRNGQ
ncbi:serine/threonine protein kinase [Streptomyces triticagri]|uniref:non-specific serine/threonine protein kinase n=1 Tax=Streptomyces triticagri TaxID=2293568 RepID=A0A372LXR4_9ACTN|nr:serine/threonine-protein kinase [Streptomyces triticagri]RFU83421.1 serine/threonine protein kinase [Streptomyces triticagri]